MRSLRQRDLLLVVVAAVGALVALRRRAAPPRRSAAPRTPKPVSAPMSAMRPPPRAPAVAPAPTVAAPPPAAVPAPAPVAPQRAESVPVGVSSPRRAPLVLLGTVALAAAGLAVAIAVTRAEAPARQEAGTTAAVLGTQASETTTAEAPAAAPAPSAALAPATASTPIRARGRALLPVPDARLDELVGARARGRVVRVDEVVGDRVFWVGTRAERLLVHLQGPGTRFAVRRGQRVSFTGVVTPTRPRAPQRWGITPEEGRQRLVRQGHHLEVWGPDMRFDCVARCGGVR